MADSIYALSDYKGFYGSKHHDSPYRSGMDRQKLAGAFQDRGYSLKYMSFAEAASLPPGEWQDKAVIYTSTEDPGLRYKSFIEDVVLYLELSGARVLPSWKHLHANNNKVFMELLRKDMSEEYTGLLTTTVFGSVDELSKNMPSSYPVVLKKAAGASGKGVMLAGSAGDLLIKAATITACGSGSQRLKEWLRKHRHKGYVPDSMNRGKFIVQTFVHGLGNDWKVYVMGSRLFVFRRPLSDKRDFRASGGGYDNYYYGKEAEVPAGLFDFAAGVFRELDVPMASLDIGYDSNSNTFLLFEFQTVYFGTAGMLNSYSKHYFVHEGSEWVAMDNDMSIEDYHASAIVEYLAAK